MHFFRHETPASPIEDLLTKLESATAEDLSPDSKLTTDVPTVEQFLEEEDILRECRSENKRLIKYVCRPDVIRSLVAYSVNPPAPGGPKDEPNGTLPSDSETTSSQEAEAIAIQRNEDEEKLRKYAYVSSELLAADVKPISGAIVGDDDVMASIFSCLENSPRGELNPLVSVFFSKVIISLLKMMNDDTIEQMSKRSPSFINSILKHMDNGPIAELLVRILDGPDADRSYQICKKPSPQVLELLVNSDVLGGLAECFVRASCDPVDGEDFSSRTAENASDDGTIGDSERDDERKKAKQRRLREETMANVTCALLGLSERILQFPSLGCRIPDKLSPYSTPTVVSRLLDAGLYASCNGEAKPDGLKAADYTASSEERVHAFTSGSNSALLHSLGLAADLMTTEANVVRAEEEEEAIGVVGQGTGVVNRQMMLGMGRAVYSGRGIGPSVAANEGNQDSTSSNPEVDEEEAQILADFANKKSGDPIVCTSLLEAELSIRFQRLSEMFGENEADSTYVRTKPLGSLRLKLAEFFVACMKKSTVETVQQIVRLKVPNKLLELFGAYQWSSMLHGVVTNSIVSALEGEKVGGPARMAWFGAGLIPWLIDAWLRNTRGEEDGAVHSRAGYMGHLIRIGTSLKAYIEESEVDTEINLPEKGELDAFASFAEQVLAPAHTIEATPLCEDALGGSGLSDGDEAEEATDVLEMGGISFVDSLTEGDSGTRDMQLKYVPAQPVEDDEDIKPVEVDDLDHFGKDDDEPQIVKANVDHDIPAALRERLDKASNIEVEPIADPKPEERAPQSAARTYDSRFPAGEMDEIANADELRGVIDSIDSSSEDEGSYVAFVDDRKEQGDASAVGTQLDGLKLSDSDRVSSLDGIVTEIDEPAPFTSSDNLHSLAANIISVPDDAGNSSDEEYEAWEDPARVLSAQTSDPAISSSKEDSKTSGVA